MTGVALAINADAGSPAYSAQQWRNAQAALMGWDGVPLAGRTGLRPMGGAPALVVTLSGSTINVGLHTGMVSPGWSALTSTYQVALTVAETHSLTPADATNPRKDRVVGQVYDDDEDPSALRLYRSEYLVGTAGPTPSEPALPAGAVHIATIDVPAEGAGSPVVTNNYQRAVAAGGILPVHSNAERDAIVSPYPGQWIDRPDRGWMERFDGTAWRSGHRHVISPTTLADITNPAGSQVVFHTTPLDWSVWDSVAGAWRAHVITTQMRQSSAQGMTVAFTPLNFNAEDNDNYNAHDTVTNNSRFVAPRAGYYRFEGGVIFTSSPAGSYRGTEWWKNGVVVSGSQVTIPPCNGAHTTVVAKTMQIPLSVGEYVQLAGAQNGGGTLNTVATGATQSTMSVEWIRQL